MKMRFSVAALFAALVTHAAFAADLLVPQQYPTIQAAVDAASNGDVVVVAPGTYNEQITIDGKAITVRSSGTASNTTIDRNNAAGDVFTIRNVPSDSVAIQGLSIARAAGDALDVEGATLLLQNLRVLYSNRGVRVGSLGILNGHDLQVLFAGGDGGGVRLDHPSSVANLGDVSFQSCGGGIGGAVHLVGGSQLSLLDATFVNCNSGSGGAIYCGDGSSLILSGGYFQGCSATFGGAVFVAGSGEAALMSVEFVACSATQYGGLAAVDNGQLSLVDCLAESTVASVKAGLCSVGSGHLAIRNLIYRNSSTTIRHPSIGGVISIGSGSADIEGLVTTNVEVTAAFSPPGCSCEAWRWYGLLIGMEGSGGALVLRNCDLQLTSRQGVCGCQCWSWESRGRLLYAINRNAVVENSVIRGGAFVALGCQGYGGHVGEFYVEGGSIEFNNVSAIAMTGQIQTLIRASGAASVSLRGSRFEGTQNSVLTLGSCSLYLDGCEFVSNTQRCIQHDSQGTLEVRNCRFVGNAGSGGSAILCGNVVPVVDRSFFRDNQQPSIGVGSYVILSNSSFCGPQVTEIATYVIEKDENHFNVDCSEDCDGDGLPDSYELNSGLAVDCNGNGVPDDCDADSGGADCDGNGVPDSCDIASGAADCDGNGVPDSCEPDCDGDDVPDTCEIASGAIDCDSNGIPDSCQTDCDGDGVIDACEIAAGAADCNLNGIPDSCEIESGQVSDFNKDGVIDSCQPSMQFAGLELEIVPIVNRGLDDMFPESAVCYRLYARTTQSEAGVLGLFGNIEHPLSLSAEGGFWQSPAGGDLASEISCDLSGALPSASYDSWFTVGLPCATGNSVQNTGLDLSAFRKGGGVMDDDGIVFVQPGAEQAISGQSRRVLLAQLTTNAAVLPFGTIGVVGAAADGVGDWIAYSQPLPTPALVDCNGNGQQDAFDIALGVSRDCDQSGVPDTCEYGSASTDCNMNGIPDLCDVTSAFSSDLNGNFVPDECECSGDVDGNGRVDVDDIIDVITSWGDVGDSAADVNNDNVVDAGDLVIVLAGYGNCL